MEHDEWRMAGFDLPEGYETEIVRDIDRRLERLSEILFTIWQRHNREGNATTEEQR